MDKMIGRFTAQIQEAIEIGRNASLAPTSVEVKNIYIVGMGGSGIGGDFVAQMIRSSCQVPFISGKDYSIPAYIDRHTLAIISSYSGNTEESLIALEQIEKRGARIICISSGGKLLDHAREKGYDFIQVPSGWSSPRACLGYSVIQQLYILEKLGLISKLFEDELIASTELINNLSDEIKSTAKSVAELIHKKTAVIYSTSRTEPAAIRLRQQLNENAKDLCWHHVVPEMNHNELVGWKKRREDLTVVVLRNEDDFNKNQQRMNIMQEVIKPLCHEYIELYSKGDSAIEKLLYFVHLGDWISWYLANLREMDTIEIDVIDYLKEKLGR